MQNIQKLLQHLPVLFNLSSTNLPVKITLALGKVKFWHFSPLLPQLSQQLWQELLFRQQTRLQSCCACLLLLPQVLAMTAFIQHFIKGFGSHQSEKCEYTNLLSPCTLPSGPRKRNNRPVKTMWGWLLVPCGYWLLNFYPCLTGHKQ